MEQPPEQAIGSYAAMTYKLNPAEKKKLARKRRRGVGFKVPKGKR